MSQITLNALLRRVLAAYHPLNQRGLALHGAPPRVRGTLPFAAFVARLRELLAASDEASRRRLERELLRLAEPLHRAGVFEVLHIAHPALARMIDDHLRERAAPAAHACRPAHREPVPTPRHPLLP